MTDFVRRRRNKDEKIILNEFNKIKDSDDVYDKILCHLLADMLCANNTHDFNVALLAARSYGHMFNVKRRRGENWAKEYAKKPVSNLFREQFSDYYYKLKDEEIPDPHPIVKRPRGRPRKYPKEEDFDDETTSDNETTIDKETTIDNKPTKHMYININPTLSF